MKRVLIVDDAIDLGRLLQDALKTVHPDIPISVVPSAEEALLESSRFTIDVLVTDIRLPGMTGLDLVRKIRVRQPNVKVILMTGLRPEDRLFKEKDQAAADVFLRKPIMTPDFIDAVDQLLGEGKPLEKPKPPEKPVDEKPAPVSEKESAQAALLQELAAVMPGEAVETAPTQPAVHKATGVLRPPVEPPAPAETGLSAILSRLRASLGALSAMLLDERGKSVAQAGDLPDLPVEAQFAPPLMASISAGARISYLLGQTSTPLVQAYRGTGVDLVIAPTGQYVLLLALPTGRSAVRLALAFEEALNAQTEILAALEAMGLRVQTAVEAGAPEVLMAEMGAAAGLEEAQIEAAILETPLGQDPGLEKFEELFKKKKTGELRIPDAESFWDEVTSDERKEESQPGVLTFEQAQKLGLFPPKEE